MRTYIILFVTLFSVGNLSAITFNRTNDAVDTLSILEQYVHKLDSLARRRDSLASRSVPRESLDAYSLYLVTPSTLYSKSVLQQFSPSADTASADSRLQRMYAINNSLARIYVNHPWLISQTQKELDKAGSFRPESDQKVSVDTRLNEKIEKAELGSDVGDVIVVTRKPNFWKFSGNGSLQFTQSYFSDNWFQGGENNYSALTMLTFNANYDNKQRIQWENKAEIQLGFQTSRSDQYHSFKPTSNLLRLTSKFGYRAVSSLYYTAQVLTYTQLVPQYQSNTQNLQSEFLGPLYLNISLGIDYKWNVNNKFSGNIYIAPGSYNLRYVKNLALSTRYGIKEGNHGLHDAGSSVNINWNYKPFKNVSWDSRMYFFSNYSYINWEWENTFNFTINKYLSAKFNVYPKFDNSAEKYHGDMGYFMLKEWLSLGLNYNW